MSAEEGWMDPLSFFYLVSSSYVAIFAFMIQLKVQLQTGNEGREEGDEVQ